MNCRQARDLLYDVIDKEASEVDVEQIQAHLQKCPKCFEIFRLEKAICRFVTEKLIVGEQSTRLEGLKGRVLTELDHVDKSRVVADKRPFRLASRTLVLAASLVILISAAFLISSYHQSSAGLVPFERAHRTAIWELDSYRNDRHTAAAVASIHDELTYDVDQLVGDFKMVGGCLREIQGIQMGHFVYCKDTVVVSVFITQSYGFEIPNDSDNSLVGKIKGDFLGRNCHGCRLVFHRNGSTVIITATTDSNVDLMSFIPGRTTV
ncbi:MAG: zf-HC2 domain-containing protein [candidate division Zixibacteria bacterium]|nr:zf-HC2 domain-containing protein [candidate division Zixibacteria bacterium]